MIRSLIVAMATAGALSVSTARALGMGEIDLYSRISQPLDAQIKLLDLGGLRSSDITSGLASLKDFKRAGVKKEPQLNDLRFSIVMKPGKEPYIHITSMRPIKEPFLNFLVELYWPGGKMLREYVLLMDSGVIDNEGSATLQSEKPTLIVDSSTQENRAESLVKTDHAETSYYKVRRNDHLWGIASVVRPQKVLSVQQTMIAIQELNPQAFIKENINLLKAGEVLSLPSMAQVQNIPLAAAVTSVARQEKVWRANFLDARKKVPSSLPARTPEKAKSEDRLEIVSAIGTSSAKNAQGTEKEMLKMQHKLMLNQEILDKVRSQNQELSSRLQDLNEQIKTLTNLITLKDQKLAALQEKLNRLSTGENLAEVNVMPSTPASTESHTEPHADKHLDSHPHDPGSYSHLLEGATPPTAKTESLIPDAPKPELSQPAGRRIQADESLLDSLKSFLPGDIYTLLTHPVFAGGLGAVFLLLILLPLLWRKYLRKPVEENEDDEEYDEKQGFENFSNKTIADELSALNNAIMEPPTTGSSSFAATEVAEERQQQVDPTNHQIFAQQSKEAGKTHGSASEAPSVFAEETPVLETSTEEERSDTTLAGLVSASDEIELESFSKTDETEDADSISSVAGEDQASTKLDLARAYIDMEDHESARNILLEVTKEGSEVQREQAQKLLDEIS